MIARNFGNTLIGGVLAGCGLDEPVGDAMLVHYCEQVVGIVDLRLAGRLRKLYRLLAA